MRDPEKEEYLQKMYQLYAVEHVSVPDPEYFEVELSNDWCDYYDVKVIEVTGEEVNSMGMNSLMIAAIKATQEAMKIHGEVLSITRIYFDYNE